MVESLGSRLRRPGLLTQVGLGCGLLALLLGAALAVSVYLNREASRSARWSAHSSQVLALVADIDTTTERFDSLIHGYEATHRADVLAPVQQGRAGLRAQLGQLVRLVSDNPRQTVAARRLAVDVGIYLDALPQTGHLDAELPPSALGRIAWAQGQDNRMDTVRATIEAFRAAERRLADERRDREARATHAVAVADLVALGGALVFALGLLAFLGLTVVWPLRRVQRAVHALADGREPIALPERGNRELRALATDFNLMAKALDEHERSMRESERRYRQLARSLPGAGVVTCDAGLHIATVEGEICRDLGWSGDLLRGTPLAALHAEHGLDHLMPHWRRALCDEPSDITLDIAGDRCVLIRFGAMRAPDGTIAGAMAVALDITERRHSELATQAAHQRQNLVLANLPGTIVALYDPQLRVVEVDGVGHDTRASVRGAHLSEFLPDADFAAAEPLMLLALAGDHAEFRHQTPAGQRFDVSVAPFEEDGRITGVLTVWHDVTRQRAAEQALRDAEQRFRGAFEQAPIGAALVDLDGRFLQVNDALEDITGYHRDRLEGMSLLALTHPDDVTQSEDALRALLDGDVAVLRIEKRYLHANGHEVWVAISSTVIRAVDGAPMHLLSHMVDITEQKRFEDRLRHMADHDPLTGLANRRRFEAELGDHVARCGRYGAAGALMVLDVDHFKSINDTLGHSAGDELIVSVARVLRDQLRETDVVARLGGDEFAILLPAADHADAETVAAKLVEAVREQATVLSGERRHRVTISLGVFLFDTGGADITAEEAIVDADLAMYDAKENGRDGYSLFIDEDQREARTKGRLTWIQRIQDAIEHERFTLHAQPILNLRTEQVTQHELLIRMVDDHGDLIPPATFLYIAERFGLIAEIDRWVIKQAVRLLDQSAGDPRPPVLEVNLSGLSLGDEQLLAQIESDLRAHPRVDPARLVFEVTETAAVADIQRARQFAERLSSLGCRFALDDFGAGFGSLYYLKHLPFDYLKIDGEFVAGAAGNRTDQLVIEAAVRLAQGLGKQTIAEFVGDETTKNLMRSLGVDFCQGYLIGRPAPIASALAAATA